MIIIVCKFDTISRKPDYYYLMSSKLLKLLFDKLHLQIYTLDYPAILWNINVGSRIWISYLQSSAVITRSNIVRYCINDCRNSGGISIGCGSMKDTPYLAQTGKLWGVFCEYFWEIDGVLTAPHSTSITQKGDMMSCTTPPSYLIINASIHWR